MSNSLKSAKRNIMAHDLPFNLQVPEDERDITRGSRVSLRRRDPSQWIMSLTFINPRSFSRKPASTINRFSCPVSKPARR